MRSCNPRSSGDAGDEFTRRGQRPQRLRPHGAHPKPGHWTARALAAGCGRRAHSQRNRCTEPAGRAASDAAGCAFDPRPRGRRVGLPTRLTLFTRPGLVRNLLGLREPARAGRFHLRSCSGDRGRGVSCAASSVGGAGLGWIRGGRCSRSAARQVHRQRFRPLRPTRRCGLSGGGPGFWRLPCWGLGSSRPSLPAARRVDLRRSRPSCCGDQPNCKACGPGVSNRR